MSTLMTGKWRLGFGFTIVGQDDRSNTRHPTDAGKVGRTWTRDGALLDTRPSSRHLLQLVGTKDMSSD